jgi:hypothetical protein
MHRSNQEGAGAADSGVPVRFAGFGHGYFDVVWVGFGGLDVDGLGVGVTLVCPQAEPLRELGDDRAFEGAGRPEDDY